MTNQEELQYATSEYQRVVAEIKMHQAMIKAALDTLQNSKDQIASLAIRLEATQTRLIELTKENDNGKQENKPT